VILDPNEVELGVIGRTRQLADAIEPRSRRHERDTELDDGLTATDCHGANLLRSLPLGTSHTPVAKVDDARGERLRLNQLEADPLIQGRDFGVSFQMRANSSTYPGADGSCSAVSQYLISS
jgi:hypothetical protein